MAHHKSAIKRSKTSQQENQRNVHYKSSLKTAIKEMLAAEDKESAQLKFKETTSLLDIMVVKGIIHKNKAANKKSRLAKQINSIA
jgi:small subunit ribosomal protein S20